MSRTCGERGLSWSRRALLIAAAATPTPAPVAAAGVTEPVFVEVASQLGLEFVHRHFGRGQKYMHETMGSGVALFDADGDGRLDVYFVQGAPASAAAATSPNRLFLQQPDGRFRDATRAAGVGHVGHGMGAAYGDIDGDGDLDLYVTNFGPNVLYRNRGDGRFEDVTLAAGVGDPSWGTSAGFFDADGDGDLDLYVVNYVNFSLDNHKWCGHAARRQRAYCHPDVYDARPDVLYLNDGRGVFRPAPLAAGVPRGRDGKGLGLAFGDLDGDGHGDVYVANDSTMNYLLRGDGRGRFVESALLSGVGFNGAGAAEAGMGVAVGDLHGDGRLDLFVTNLDGETNTLYRNQGGGLFTDVTAAAGLAKASLPYVGFGTVLLDYDHDGDLDLLVANGHIIDNIALFDASRSHRQPVQLFENRGGGRLVEVSDRLGVSMPLVGRGAATGDLDADGDLDVVLTQNDGRALVLLNRLTGPGAALAVRLRGVRSNRQGFGARLEMAAGGRRQVRLVDSASSYLSQGGSDVVFGLGDAVQADRLTVRWPSGQVDRHGPLRAGFVHTLVEGQAAVQAHAFGDPRP